ncbi:hypothetical protein AKJ51_02360 [candidate division MSBL1 archaeon SCGC-AAA382A20]|uniref:Uncharacterized protein n=1 Tax=candidate division MSBL1 archaeon SCGC-AAA382A20 TaxID=1698280 RepID=A0A133VKL1_9EURY|nr:hypothetical protein AKJ51_02360 [candidate division MSBL1 archaeon SCGC-AAA382A20]
MKIRPALRQAAGTTAGRYGSAHLRTTESVGEEETNRRAGDVHAGGGVLVLGDQVMQILLHHLPVDTRRRYPPAVLDQLFHLPNVSFLCSVGKLT